MKKSEISKIFDVSLTTIDNWVRQGCPFDGVGRGKSFDAGKIHRWLLARLENTNPPATLVEARIRREHYTALAKELDYLERTGKLISVDAVEKEGARIGKAVKDALLNIPKRLAGILAAETDQDRIVILLTDEISNSLEALKTVIDKGNKNKK